MNEFDAYAPPRAEVGTGAPRKKSKRSRTAGGAIDDAIARLNEHLADPQAVALDRQEAGGRLRRPTIGFIIFTVIAVIAATAVITSGHSRRWEPMEIAFAVIAGFVAFITAILLFVDLRFLPRDKPTSPDETLKYFFRAIAMARLGYAWAALCPTARAERVDPPYLGPVPVGQGSFTLRSTQDLKDYTQTFARPGNGQMRTMQIKRTTLLREDGDVAIVEVDAVFQSWPQWAQILCVIAFVIIRLLGLVLFLVLYFSLRKTHAVVIRKTLIRGSNGVWYVYSGNLLE
jgi:amino acid transporter